VISEVLSLLFRLKGIFIFENIYLRGFMGSFRYR
jgi:hypothetical protein